MQGVFIDYVKELISRYNCVIIPGLGAFVSQEVPAAINDEGQIFPPRKKVGFNGQLKSNDGLLLHYLAVRQGISLIKAEQQCKFWTDRILKSLEEKPNLELEGLGTLWIQEKTLRFRPDPSAGFCAASFGLTSIHIQRIPERESGVPPQVKPEPVMAVRSKQEEKEVRAVIPAATSSGWRKWRWAAALLPFALAAAALTNGSQNNWAGWPDPLGTTETVYQNRTETFHIDGNYSPDQSEDTAPTDQVFFTAEWIAGKRLPVYNREAYRELRDKYHIIGGAFRSLENAEKAVRQFTARGYEAHIISRQFKLYRVSIASAPTRREALQISREVQRTEDIMAWVARL